MKGLFIPLLLTGLCQAVRVYLHPEPHVPHRLPASKAGAVLSKHLDLERFEDASPFAGEQEILFGQGPSTGVLVRISAEDAQGAFYISRVNVGAVLTYPTGNRRCPRIHEETLLLHQL